MASHNNRTLISDPQYQGKYVAFASCNDNTVVGSGKSRKEARKQAIRQGLDDPFVLYVPTSHRVHCIHAHC